MELEPSSECVISSLTAVITLFLYGIGAQISETIYQLDFYSKNQLEAELMAHNFLNLII